MIDQYQNLIYSVCLKAVGNPFDAEDLTQETFLAAYKNLADFDGTYEKAWLCKIAARKCLDFLKNSGRRTIPTEEEYFARLPDSHNSAEDTYLQRESQSQTEALCRKLKSPYREVAIEHFCLELSAREIAIKHQKNLKTIQTQIYRAKAMLKKLLERSDAYDQRTGKDSSAAKSRRRNTRLPGNSGFPE
ncbi:RNA polymerase sigma factor [Blautia sp. An249]|uniref:RNA polymerase sigma factor n=1 Tax=Blautia sp. An249 TaxID=1965603 RepID=UPI001FA8E8F3|nr:sigma-70 family RNA polymerase sigma factor [Blautia sp. An249]